MDVRARRRVNIALLTANWWVNVGGGVGWRRDGGSEVEHLFRILEIRAETLPSQDKKPHKVHEIVTFL